MNIVKTVGEKLCISARHTGTQEKSAQASDCSACHETREIKIPWILASECSFSCFSPFLYNKFISVFLF